jgi:hypothetical protein
MSNRDPLEVPVSIRRRSAAPTLRSLTFAFIPKGTGVLLVPVPKRDALKGLVRGASSADYRDRADRF